MARSSAGAEQGKVVNYRGLRGWLDEVEKLGELERVSGANWDVEMGALAHMLTEKSHGTALRETIGDARGMIPSPFELSPMLVADEQQHDALEE